MDNELCKCGKVGKISCPNDERCGDYNTQLPAEVVADIHTKADAYIRSSEDEGAEWGAYVNGATEYAIKLHQSKLANANLKTEFDLYKDEVAERRTVSINAIKLLKKVIERHEAGLLPDTFIYNEIKSFLDGTK